MSPKQDIHRPDSLKSITDKANEIAQEATAHDSQIHHDGKRGSGIVVPKNISYATAAQALQQQAEAEDSQCRVTHKCMNKHFIPAAYALSRVLSERYGVDFANPKPGFFSVQYPTEYVVPLSPTENTRITLGEFTLADMKLETGIIRDDNNVDRLVTQVTCKQRDKDAAQTLCELIDSWADIWAGQCLIFEGEGTPRIPTLASPSLTLDDIALNPHESAAVNMFVNQIRNWRILDEQHSIPFKRGVLMYGPWGTGKTLASAVAMQAAIKAGITVIHERNWSQLQATMHLARTMQPCLVFCEDIDRMQDRSLINMLDDASLKDCAISLVVTTNNPERLDPALTRTGRLDICIGFELPQSAARQRILAINGVEPWSPDIDNATDGFTGSDLAEVAKRARINAIAEQRDLTADDVLAAAVSMVKPPEYVAPDTLPDAIRQVFNVAFDENQALLEVMAKRIAYLYDQA